MEGQSHSPDSLSVSGQAFRRLAEFGYGDDGYITAAEHARRIAVAEAALDHLCMDEGWQDAVAPVDPHTKTSVYVVTPELRDAASQAVRAGADRANDLWFAAKDGDDPHETAQKYAPYSGGDIRVSVVDHHPSGCSEVRAALRVIEQQPGKLLPSFDAIETEWGKDPAAALDEVILPDGDRASKLLTIPGVYDITLASMAPDLRKSLRGAHVLAALYNATLAIVKQRGGRYLIGTMDVDGVFAQLAGRGSEAWIDAMPDDHRPVLTSIRNSNLSTFAICDIDTWRRDNFGSPRLRTRANLFWGDTLAREKGFAFNVAEDRAPSWNEIPARPYRFPMDEIVRYSGRGNPDVEPDDDAPVLLMDLDVVGETYDAMEETLPAEICYAMKCNPHDAVLRYLIAKGCNFEVASINELNTLARHGADIGRVLFSNPVKLPSHIKRAFNEGKGVRTFAFQSEDEIEKLAEHAPGSRVYVRLQTAPGVGVVGSEGKFGVSVDRALSLLQMARSRGLEPYGLSFHVGSQAEKPRAWLRALKVAGELVRRWDAELPMVDMGGGFPAYHKRHLPRLDQIADAIYTGLDEWPEYPRRLVVEPGRGLVADAGVLVTTVVGVTNRPAERIVHTNAGFLVEPVESNHTLQYPVADSRQSEHKAPATITAATCDSQDIIMRGAVLSADLRVGDVVAIGTMGAYSTAYEGDFNGFPRTRIVPKAAGGPSVEMNSLPNLAANHNGYAAWSA